MLPQQARWSPPAAPMGPRLPDVARRRVSQLPVGWWLSVQPMWWEPEWLVQCWWGLRSRRSLAPESQRWGRTAGSRGLDRRW